MSGTESSPAPHPRAAGASRDWPAYGSFLRPRAPQPRPTGRDRRRRWMDRGARSFLFLIPAAERPLAHAAQMVIFTFDVRTVWFDARKIGHGWHGKICSSLLQTPECFLDQRNIDELQLTGLSSAAKAN